MTVIAYWRTGNTRPAIYVDLDLGTDPSDDTTRVLDSEDTVTIIWRNPDAAVPAAVMRACTVENLDPPTVSFKPEDGDFDESGTYDVVFDITDTNEDVETVPDRVSVSYQFEIGAKPGDED